MDTISDLPPLVIKRGSNRIELSHPIIAAPMAGSIEPPYRMVLHENGMELSYTEMISARGTFEGSSRTMELAGWVPQRGFSGAQVFGPSSQYLDFAARRMEEIGHHLIDLNTGCPKRKVLAHGAGGAMLKDTKNLLHCLSSLMDSVKIPVGLKTRSGYNVFDEGPFMELLKDVEGIGISYVTVHPRTVVQGFRGKADRDVISKVSGKVDIPIIASGDVRSPGDVLDYVKRGASGIMVGRGLLGDPFLIDRLLDGDERSYPSSRKDLGRLFSFGREHLRRSVEHYGERRGSIKFRTHLGWYVQKFKGKKSFSDRIFHVKTEKEVIDLMKDIEMDWSSFFEPC